MDIRTPLQLVAKLTKPQTAALKKLGIQSVTELLLYFPYRYLDFSKVSTIRELKPGENVSLKVTVKNITSRFSFRGRLSLAEAIVSDDTGSLKVVWFNQGYLAKTIQKGEIIYLAGAPDYYKNSLQLTNPIYEKETDFPVHTARLVPVYHLTAGLYPKTLRNLAAKALPAAEQLSDILPPAVLGRQELPQLSRTVHLAHFPKSVEEADLAKKRLAFEEIFLTQLAAQKTKLEMAAKRAPAIPFDQKLIRDFVSTLPFQLTPHQKRAAWDILQDMEKPAPMNRLVEGDVGSGKTLVALMAALQAVSAGHQVAFLAPTEILARQHLETALRFLGCDFHGRKNRVADKIVLLTNHYARIGKTDEPKAKVQALLREGMPGLYIGTHALSSEKVIFTHLALVIIDEQHRFGVEQRSQLIRSNGSVPHLLSLTATPIPRSLQLAMYGELEISQIKGKPAGRKPIVTRLVDLAKRRESYDFIAQQITAGRQAFVITPLVEESDKLGVKAASTEAKSLEKIFPRFKIGLMHGRLKGAEKERVMNDFLAKKYDILVSTSVVEVGVDVPNATVMVIEGAERFGLAQLHQFRGRVGRSEHQSYCLLFTSPSPVKEEDQNEAIEMNASASKQASRLEAFCKSQDGFQLAEFDLKTRGFGDLYGSQQSGWNFKYFSPAYLSLVAPAREEALTLLQEDITLAEYPLLKEKIKDKVIHFE